MKYCKNFSLTHLEVDSSKDKIFVKDSIHREIDFLQEDFWLYELLNTFEFQRLSRIKQLGLSYLNFPSSIHTRLTHSLGVYELANQFIHSFKERSQLDSSREVEMNILKISALLHDLGHGPWSHNFEKVFDFSHEQFLEKILFSDTKTSSILKKKALQEAREEDFYLKAVRSVINHEGTYPWIEKIMSSDIDLDRLDYLTRDSFHSGLQYGVLDMKLFKSWMKLVPNSVGGLRLSFSDKSKHLIESYLISREYMYLELYRNSVTVSYEQLFLFIIDSLRDTDVLEKLRLVDSETIQQHMFLFRSSDSWSVEDFLSVDDSSFEAFLLEAARHLGGGHSSLISLFFGFGNTEHVMLKLSEKEWNSLDEFSKNSPVRWERLITVKNVRIGEVKTSLVDDRTQEFREHVFELKRENDPVYLAFITKDRYKQWLGTTKIT